MLIGPPIHERQLFKKLTLKIQGQGHGWGQSSKSQCECNILSTHIPFVPCQSGIPLLSYDFFKIWPWNSRLKVIDEVTVQSQCVYNILSTHIPFVPCQLTLPFLWYSVFKIWPWKSSQGHGWGHSLSQNEGLTSTSLLFHVNQAFHSWVMTFSKFDLENQGSRSLARSQFKVTMWIWHPVDSHPFHSMLISPPIPEIQHFQNLTLKIKGQGQMTMMLHNYRSRKFHRTSNGINLSSGSKDMGSAKVWPKCCLI